MPLPRSEREIDLLTQGWPGGPEDFELAAFAARFRADRPELSEPALDRIGRQVEAELDRLDRSATRKIAVRTAVQRYRRFALVAAAAVLVLSVGAWVHFRAASPGGDRGMPVQGLPVIHAHPAPSPDGAPAPAATKPIVN